MIIAKRKADRMLILCHTSESSENDIVHHAHTLTIILGTSITKGFSLPLTFLLVVEPKHVSQYKCMTQLMFDSISVSSISCESRPLG